MAGHEGDAAPRRESTRPCSGAIFSVVLGGAGRHRRCEQLSLPWFTTLGAVGGLLLGAVAVAGGFPAGTLALARMGEQRELQGGTDPARVTSGR